MSRNLLVLRMLLCRLGKAAKEGMGDVRFRAKFRMKLASHKPRMVRDFNDLNQISLGVDPADSEPRLFQDGSVGVVKFKTVTVSFLNLCLGIRLLGC